MEPTYTERGFAIVDFTDINGHECSMQCSSAIGDYEDSMDNPGTSYLWLGMNKNAPPHDRLKTELSPRMHLDREQVSELVRLMSLWLKKGNFQ